METIQFSVPGMKSPHCQMTVSNAVRNAGGVVEDVRPTLVTVALDAPITRDQVADAIRKAGYAIAG